MLTVARWLALASCMLTAGACSKEEPPKAAPDAEPSGPPTALRAADVIIQSSLPRPPFAFSAEDEALLDEVQRGAFKFLWEHAGPETGMAPDRSSKPMVSVAGVGFQLSAIPIGVERGWISRAEGEARAKLILSSLVGNPLNRKAGLFFHYIDPVTAGPSHEGYEVVVSTIDSALLFAGVITASSYFGGEVSKLGDELLAGANWKFFAAGEEAREFERGFISLAWKPTDTSNPTGDGALVPYYWLDNGDEHKLVTFLAVAAPTPAHAVDPLLYYKLRRQIGQYGDSGPIVWFPWSGALFTAFFAHCWLDYAAMGPDNPAAHGVLNRVRTDWWENSRRLTNMHRAKALENPAKLAGFGANHWGLSASDVKDGYAVAHLFPDPIRLIGAIPELDYPPGTATESWGDGTVAPYAAGCSIMFEPQAAVAALRHYKSLKDGDGKPLVWREPSSRERDHCGFLDAFNLSATPAPWVASDYVAIDQGPLILAIENARTGLVWRLFHEHPTVRGGMEKLGLLHNRTPRNP